MILKRIASTPRGTFGVLIIATYPFAVTLENPWLDNEVMVSCIPLGKYICRRIDSPKFGNTFEVTDVEGRTHILFHKGNTEEDTSGCILVGEEYGFLGGERAVLASSRGYNEFMNMHKGSQSFELSIVDA